MWQSLRQPSSESSPAQAARASQRPSYALIRNSLCVAPMFRHMDCNFLAKGHRGANSAPKASLLTKAALLNEVLPMMKSCY